MNNPKIAIIGLGYVGLPLAVEFGKIIETKGFDINKKRVEELKKGKDSTLEVEPENLVTAAKLCSFTRSKAPAWECIN
jgi:UDP-N-acetyl-D-galactosamine dehydrogenase